MIICLGHEKGGTGKSSLATSFAAKIASMGNSVMVLDTDSTATSVGWYAIREHNKTEPVIPVVQQLVEPARSTVSFASKYDAVVVDIGARDYEKLGDMARICDLWVAPITVGQGDLTSTIRFYEALTQYQHLHKKKRIPLVAAINRVTSAWNSSEVADATEFLREQCPGLIVLTTTLKERRAWRDAGRQGLGISEMPPRDAQKAIEEFDALFVEALGHQSK